MGIFGQTWEWLSNDKNQKVLALLGGAVTTIAGGSWALYVYLKAPVEKPAPPQPTTQIGSVTGTVNVQNTVNQIEKGDYVDQRTIVLNISASPDALAQIASALQKRAGVDKQLAQNPPGNVPEDVSRQITELVAAQKQAAGQGTHITPQAAYDLGMLAAYKKDTDTALDYFRQATQADPNFTDAFEMIAALQQSQAMSDMMVNRDYKAAQAKLSEARDAAMHTDPLSARSLALRGFVSKSLAELSESTGNPADQAKYYVEAERLFEQASKLDPNDPSAQNGLGDVLFARGNADGAIAAFTRAIKLAPTYTAAHNDLALAFEAKMKSDPANASQWCQKAVQSWGQTLQLASNDPGFSPEMIQGISQHAANLKQQCGQPAR